LLHEGDFFAGIESLKEFIEIATDDLGIHAGEVGELLIRVNKPI
jgi:hypothetical protein